MSVHSYIDALPIMVIIQSGGLRYEFIYLVGYYIKIFLDATKYFRLLSIFALKILLFTKTPIISKRSHVINTKHELVLSILQLRWENSDKKVIDNILTSIIMDQSKPLA